jgi:hypothetical protein
MRQDSEILLGHGEGRRFQSLAATGNADLARCGLTRKTPRSNIAAMETL